MQHARMCRYDSDSLPRTQRTSTKAIGCPQINGGHNRAPHAKDKKCMLPSKQPTTASPHSNLLFSADQLSDPAVQSMRCQQMLGSNSIEMKNAELVVESCCLSKSGQPLCTLHLNGAQAGNWQTFAFSPDVESWIRVADLRHAMSRYILVLLTSLFTNVSLILNM
jgi:hypothetical protein